jgi:hypothetical protein
MRRAIWVSSIVFLMTGINAQALSRESKQKVDVLVRSFTTARDCREAKESIEKAALTGDEGSYFKKALKRNQIASAALGRLCTGSTQPKLELRDRAARASAPLIAKVIADLQAEQNRRVLRANAVLAERLKITNPALACARETPQAEKIEGTPITPGETFTVTGKGFGETAGAVSVTVDAKTFPAIVQRWNSCVIAAKLDPTVEGVHGGTAYLNITTAAGKAHRPLAVFFEPLLEPGVVMVYGWSWLFGWYGRSWEIEGMPIVFTDWVWRDQSQATNDVQPKLKNDYKITGLSKEQDGNGSCKIADHAEIGKANVKVWALTDLAVGGNESVTCWVFASLAGPKGLRPF